MQGLRYQELRVFLLARYARLRQWPSELNLERRDHRIEADSEQGKLDPLIAEAHESKENGTPACRSLPGTFFIQRFESSLTAIRSYS